ncbi:tetratricopeptide repeat protein [Deinococcus sp.]|uniref:tetratricopeptide repeat protein n=1 Tax=Deinococcus sp. TaxID=47478 RepID=UPI00286E4031|nr:tetratricopeptide repeat protein [Deinococcus sp.]
MTAQPPVPPAPDRTDPYDSAPEGLNLDRSNPGVLTPDGLNLDGLNLDWAGYLRQGEYRRALAAARIGEAENEVQAALEVLYDLQDAVRARRLSLAQRQAERLQGHLEAMTQPGVFRAILDPAAIGAGLEALLAADRERLTDPQLLEFRLERALAQGLTRAEAFNTLGVLHALQDREAQARQTFGEAIAHDPGHYRALTNLGNMALEGGDATGAERMYRQAIALNGDYAGAHHNLGVALRKLGRVGDSVRAIKAGQRLSVRQTRRDQDDELKADPRTQRTVQLLRIGMIVLVVLLVLLAAKGKF